MAYQQLIVFLINFLQILANILSLLILGRVLVSWFSAANMGQRGQVYMFFHRATEPIMRITRKLPHRIGMFDLSPIIAWFGIDLISRLLILFLSNLL